MISKLPNWMTFNRRPVLLHFSKCRCLHCSQGLLGCFGLTEKLAGVNSCTASIQS